MSAWQNSSPAEPSSFSFQLEQAAEPGSYSSQDNRLPRRILRIAAVSLGSGWQWLRRVRAAQAAGRRIRVTETVSLGEKRFLSIVQVDDAQFLIGTSATSVQLLTHLAPPLGGAARMAPEVGESV